VIYARSVTLRTVGRMIVGPAAIAAAVGVLLRPLGPAVAPLAVAAFLTTQLVAGGQSRWQLEAPGRRLAASRARRKQLRRQRRA
jgi:hypothetical protein